MANFKNITDLPVAESAEGLNLIVNDNGSAKQIAADKIGVDKIGGGGDAPDMVIEVQGTVWNTTFTSWDTESLYLNIVSGSYEQLADKLNAGDAPKVILRATMLYGDQQYSIALRNVSAQYTTSWDISVGFVVEGGNVLDSCHMDITPDNQVTYFGACQFKHSD